MNARLKFVLITLSTVVAVAITGGMGLWQLSRAAEKQARQAALDVQSAKSPLDAAGVRAAPDPMALLHQRARLRGTWVADQVIFLENRPMDGRMGLIVLMPFVLEGPDRTVLVVQRGWAPRGFEDRTLLPTLDTPTGVVEIEGRMALPPSDLYALGKPTVGPIRQNLDLPQWRVETGLPLLPITLQQTGPRESGLLRDWPVVNLGVEKNYGYAVQWFGMASVFVVLYVWFQIIRRFYIHPQNTSHDV